MKLSEEVEGALDRLFAQIHKSASPDPKQADKDLALIRRKLEETGCQHNFESNPGMYDTNHPYCTKCGRAE